MTLETRIEPKKALESFHSFITRGETSSGSAFTDRTFALYCDSQDGLASFRSQFCIPRLHTTPGVDPEWNARTLAAQLDKQAKVEKDAEVIYFCSNSLGLMPARARQEVDYFLERWARLGVLGHIPISPSINRMPWEAADECVQEDAARLVGALPGEVALMNGLTVNLHLLLVAFYRPDTTTGRRCILLEAQAFPSDYYALVSQLRLNGLITDERADVRELLIVLEPRPGEATLRTEDIVRVIEERGREISVICLGALHYYTGQLFDVEAITQAGQRQGCVVGWNLAHAVGNVELRLHDWGVDFACWCSYKYLSSGAGGIAGAFVHSRHNTGPGMRKLQGWWGHRRDTRFRMDNSFDEMPGAASLRVSNPPPLLCATLRASLDVFLEAGGMSVLRAKSLLLTGYLEKLLMHYFSKKTNEPLGRSFIDIITPSDPEQRGAQLSLRFTIVNGVNGENQPASSADSKIEYLESELRKYGILCDVRKPDVVRVAPAPLINRFEEVWLFVEVLKTILIH